MKRLLPVLAALILTALFPIQALAMEEDESVTIQAGIAQGEVDSTVDIPIRLTNCFSVDSVEFDVNYDPAVLAIVSVTPGDVFPAEYCIYNIEIPGRVLIACARALGFTGDGTILTLRFKILSEKGSALTITTHMKAEFIGKEVSRVDETDPNYTQSFSYVRVENGGVGVNDAPIPEPIITPWIPETPVPSPTPTPSPTPAPTMEALAQSSAEDQQEAATQDAEPVDPIAYVVVAALVVLLIVLITVSVVKRRRQAAADAPSNHPVRKDT